MSARLEAAEALLATLHTARQRLSAMSYLYLPFDRAVAVEMRATGEVHAEHARMALQRRLAELASFSRHRVSATAVEPELPVAVESTTGDRLAVAAAAAMAASAAALAEVGADEPGFGEFFEERDVTEESSAEPAPVAHPSIESTTVDEGFEAVPQAEVAALEATIAAEMALGTAPPIAVPEPPAEPILDETRPQEAPTASVEVVAPAEEDVPAPLEDVGEHDEVTDPSLSELLEEEPSSVDGVFLDARSLFDGPAPVAPRAVPEEPPAQDSVFADAFAPPARDWFADDEEETQVKARPIAGEPAPAARPVLPPADDIDDGFADARERILRAPPGRPAAPGSRQGSLLSRPFSLEQVDALAADDEDESDEEPVSAGTALFDRRPVYEPDEGPVTEQEPSDRYSPGDRDRLWSDDAWPAGAPSLGVPRVVDQVVPGEEPTEVRGAASVQILGVGRARTITPTLELGAADDASDADEAASLLAASAGLSVTFEEPDGDPDSSQLPRLTEQQPPPPTPGLASMRENEDSFVVPPAADVPEPDQVREFFELARSAENRGDLPQAILYFGDLLGLAPHHLEAHLGRGRCLMELGDYSAAMSDFQRAEDLAPTSPEPVVEMGNLYFARKEYRRAIEFYDHAVELDPAHAMAHCRRGICHFYRKNHQEAFDDLKKAYDLDPEIPNLRKYVQMAVKAMGST